MSEIVLENSECRKCKGHGGLMDRDGYFPCDSCNGTGSIGYLITESQVLEIVEAMQMLLDINGWYGKGGAEEIGNKALSILVREP